MSADFEKILVKDPRLDVSDSIKYAVVKGGQNVTASPFLNISESDSQVVWNIQVPSEQTIVDRRVLWSSTLTITVDVSSNIIYGVTWALASFPLHQLISVMSATINNNTVSLNVNDVLPAIIRLICCDDLNYYNSSSPTFADTVVVYPTSTALLDINNPNSSLWGKADVKNPHRGCFAPKTYTSTSYVFELAEPLLISPFIFGNLKANGQGFYGIQNMNFVLNKTRSEARVARGNCACSAAVTSDSKLLFMFLTPHPSDLMPARNIVPFYELPRYITAFSNLSASTVSDGPGAAATAQIVLNTLQLNQVPDKLIIYCRRAVSNVSTQSDTAIVIRGVSINFNNNSGILASASAFQLWQMSRDNGLQSTWTDYSGFGNTSTAAAGATTTIGTVGSYLVLEFGKDIQLTEDFYACGSLGNFNLQVTLNVANNTATNFTSAGNAGQVVLITMNSGVFVNERGTSSTYTGILTKQDVLEASQQEHYTHNDVGRMVGGGFFDMIKSGVSSLAKKGLQMGKEHLKKHGKKYLHEGAQMAQNIGKNALAKYLQ
jgi:hypothetical protein